MLRVDDVTVAYDGTPAVQGAHLVTPAGSVTAILGPSGCGKSTLLRAVAGLEPLQHGTIAWDDEDLAPVATHKRGFALMFQDGQLFGHLTVARNVGYALRIRGRRRAAVAEKVTELLALVGLEGYADRLPGTLSGGERQRVALARSLAADPRLLLLDEPLSALDSGLRVRLAGDLREILRRAGTTTLLVTHDHEEAFAIADHLVVMREGRIVQQGPIADVWAAPVDAETALFLGYSRVVTDRTASLLLGAQVNAGTDLALRRSALEVDARGTLAGVVLAARSTPDQTRLVVALRVAGEQEEVDAVAAPGTPVVVGDEVRLRFEPARSARIGSAVPA